MSGRESQERRHFNTRAETARETSCEQMPIRLGRGSVRGSHQSAKLELSESDKLADMHPCRAVSLF
jgi:hypothetical protein